jgi:hypothetical protein
MWRGATSRLPSGCGPDRSPRPTAHRQDPDHPTPDRLEATRATPTTAFAGNALKRGSPVRRGEDRD